VKIIFCTFFWLIAFAIYRHLSPSGIVFYQGIFISIPILFIYYLLNRGRTNCSNQIFIIFLLTYSINITIITTIDRAYSIKMLLWINDDPGGKKSRDLELLFANNFIKSGGIEKRIDEQLVSGNISRDEHDTYRITQRGEVLTKIFRYLKDIYNLK